MENANQVMDCLDDQNNLIDRLEDEIIDHPPANAGAGQFSDESFQHKLNERAKQLQEGGDWSSSGPSDPYSEQNNNAASYLFLYVKPNLVYDHADHGDLQQELDQWFVSADFAVLGLESLKSGDVAEFDRGFVPNVPSVDLWQPSGWLDLCVYYALGQFGELTSELDHLCRISIHCKRLMLLGAFPVVVQLLAKSLDASLAMILETAPKRPTKDFLSNYFKLMTVVYFSLNVALVSAESLRCILPVLKEADLMTKIVRLSAMWKVYPTPTVRIRNCLLLYWKLLLVEFGDSKHLKLVDEYLVQKYDIKNKDRKDEKSRKLTCSRVDYFTFGEDLHDKYPMGKEAPDLLSSHIKNDEGDDLSSLSTLLLDSLSLSQEREIFMATKLHSSSVSNLIEIPRTNKLHSVYGTLPGHTVHIATPVPSPPSTPSEFMSGGEKVRKLYHVNQGLPFIYPFDDQHKIPHAINEASQLIEDGIYESYLAKRISRERAILLAKERGNNDDLILARPEEDNEFCFADGANNRPDEPRSVGGSLGRVHCHYRSVLKHLRGFVDVLVNVIKTSKIEVSLRDLERELDPNLSFSGRFGGGSQANNKILEMVHRQLDLLRAKETTLKAVSAILVLTLRWYKASHPLKAYYFSSLLFDARYPSVFVEFLADSFNNSALQNFPEENKGVQVYDILASQNRILNPAIRLPELSFFKACLKQPLPGSRRYTLVNKVPIGKLPRELDAANKSVVNITDFNRDFCFALVNLSKVMNKVLIKDILQRIFVFNETKPTDLLKVILLNYVNEDLRKPILKIFKKIIPFQGRKWRALNMDVVSLIYLHMKLSLKDNWLSGKDLENEFKDSLDQEISLRSLMQFYNVRHFPEEMESLGYTSRG